MKNLVFFIIGGVFLLHLAGISKADVERAIGDFREWVDQELEDWRNGEGPRPVLQNPDGGPTMITPDRPNTDVWNR